MPKDQLASAQRRLSPEETALEERFCGYQLKARASLEPPNYAYIDYDQIETDSYSFEVYEDFRWVSAIMMMWLRCSAILRVSTMTASTLLH